VKHSRLVAAIDTALADLGVSCAGQTIVVGLSGGADSVGLLDGLATVGPRRGLRVVAAHLDHGLRPDSAADALFCADLCAQLGVPFRAGRADVAGRARREGGGIEQAARLERYAFLRQVRGEEGAVAVAVAHTRDDQAETVLLRLLRGAGRSGLSAMRVRRADILRPLLDVSREEVRCHLRSRGLTWREDPSNADPAFLRNRVRRELMPYLESRFNPRIGETLARSAALLADEAELLGSLAGGLYDRAARREGEGVSLSRGGLAAAPPALRRLAVRRALEETGGLRGVSAAVVERLLVLAGSAAPSGRRLSLPGGRVALFRFGDVWVGPRTEPRPGFAYPLGIPGRVELPGGVAVVAGPAEGPPASQGEAAVVAAPEGEPLLVRTRRPGDRVWRHGRKMSLKRFFMEQRVPADRRGALPLVAAGSEVLWVPGEPQEPGRGGRLVSLRLERSL
jgi:tRNA(Ile)-lysidine synthase